MTTPCTHCGCDGDWHTSHHRSCPNAYRELAAAEARLVPQPLRPVCEIGLNALFNTDRAFAERNR